MLINLGNKVDKLVSAPMIALITYYMMKMMRMHFLCLRRSSAVEKERF